MSVKLLKHLVLFPFLFPFYAEAACLSQADCFRPVQASNMRELVGAILTVLQKNIPDNGESVTIGSFRERNHQGMNTAFGAYLHGTLKSNWNKTFRNHSVNYGNSKSSMQLEGKYWAGDDNLIVQMKLRRSSDAEYGETQSFIIALDRGGWGRYDPFVYYEDTATVEAERERHISPTLSVDLFVSYIDSYKRYIEGDQDLVFPICAEDDEDQIIAGACDAARVTFKVKASNPVWVYLFAHDLSSQSQKSFQLELDDWKFIKGIHGQGSVVEIMEESFIEPPAGVMEIQIFAIPITKDKDSLPSFSTIFNKKTKFFELDRCQNVGECMNMIRAIFVEYARKNEVDFAEDLLKYTAYCSNDSWSCGSEQ
jgi:hypothetical protein